MFNRGLAEGWVIGKQNVLSAVGAISSDQARGQLWRHGLGAIAIDVVQRQEDLQRLIFNRLPAEGEQRFNEIIIVAPGGGRTGEASVVLAMRMLDKQRAPDVEIARHQRLAIRTNTQGGGQQYQIGAGAKDGPRRAGAGDLAAQSLIKTPGILRLLQI